MESLTVDEVIRRLRAMIATAPKERPISLDKLERLAGLNNGECYDIADRGTMRERTRLGLSRALLLVENDQVVITKRKDRTHEMTIREKQKPPQVLVRRVCFTAKGPKVQFVAQNPRTFPNFKGHK